MLHTYQRLKASQKYFSDKIDALLSTMRETTATTDSRTNAREYDDSISTLFTVLCSKHMITATAHNFSVEAYYGSQSFQCLRFQLHHTAETRQATLKSTT